MEKRRSVWADRQVLKVEWVYRDPTHSHLVMQISSPTTTDTVAVDTVERLEEPCIHLRLPRRTMIMKVIRLAGMYLILDIRFDRARDITLWVPIWADLNITADRAVWRSEQHCNAFPFE